MFLLMCLLYYWLIEMAWAWECNIIFHLSFGAFYHPQTKLTHLPNLSPYHKFQHIPKGGSDFKSISIVNDDPSKGRA